MNNTPNEINYDTVISSGEKFCVGHCVGYKLHVSGHFFTAYENNPISYVHIDLNDSKISVFFNDGASFYWTNSCFGAYITQFGVSVSRDGKYVFAQTYENGLYCFLAKTGEIVWKTKSKSGIQNIYVNDQTVCANNSRKMLKIFDVNTGEITAQRKVTINEFYAVDCNRFMCRTTSKKWEIVNSTTLETTDTFHSDDTSKVREWFGIFYS